MAELIEVSLSTTREFELRDDMNFYADDPHKHLTKIITSSEGLSLLKKHEEAIELMRKGEEIYDVK